MYVLGWLPVRAIPNKTVEVRSLQQESLRFQFFFVLFFFLPYERLLSTCKRYMDGIVERVVAICPLIATKKLATAPFERG